MDRVQWIPSTSSTLGKPLTDKVTRNLSWLRALLMGDVNFFSSNRSLLNRSWPHSARQFFHLRSSLGAYPAWFRDFCCFNEDFYIIQILSSLKGFPFKIRPLFSHLQELDSFEKQIRTENGGGIASHPLTSLQSPAGRAFFLVKFVLELMAPSNY